MRINFSFCLFYPNTNNDGPVNIRDIPTTEASGIFIIAKQGLQIMRPAGV
jgi:hypothetical protein